MRGFAARLRATLHRLVRDSESGQAMTEFVIVFPIQLMLSLCIVQYALIANAHVVVNQAAFLGARAAAVSDAAGMGATDAARRVAARTVAVLTSNFESVRRGDAPEAEGPRRLAWRRGDDQAYGYALTRDQEAYELLEVAVHRREGYVMCEVQFDYVLWIPVANRFFAFFGEGGAGTAPFFFGAYPPITDANEATQRDGRNVCAFPVRRTQAIVVPWTRSSS